MPHVMKETHKKLLSGKREHFQGDGLALGRFWWRRKFSDAPFLFEARHRTGQKNPPRPMRLKLRASPSGIANLGVDKNFQRIVALSHSGRWHARDFDSDCEIAEKKHHEA